MASGTIKADTWTEYDRGFTPNSGYAQYDLFRAYKKGKEVYIRFHVTKSDQSVFAQTRHTVGTLSEEFRPKGYVNRPVSASNGINSYLTRITNIIIAANGQVILDCYQNNDVKQVTVEMSYVTN